MAFKLLLRAHRRYSAGEYIYWNLFGVLWKMLTGWMLLGYGRECVGSGGCHHTRNTTERDSPESWKNTFFFSFSHCTLALGSYYAWLYFCCITRRRRKIKEEKLRNKKAGGSMSPFVRRVHGAWYKKINKCVLCCALGVRLEQSYKREKERAQPHNMFRARASVMSGLPGARPHYGPKLACSLSLSSSLCFYLQ